MMPAPVLRWLLLLLCLLAGPAVGAGVDTATQTITIGLSGEPPTLDSSLAEDASSSFVLNLISEGLVRFDRRGRVQPAVATHWQMDGRNVRFHLRADALWADGRPVTAADFVFAFRRLVTPATGASGSTYFVDRLQNGSAILRGEMPPAALGVSAPDARTLEVELSRPVPYFVELMATTPFRPLREDFVTARGSEYAAQARALLSNGPFVLSRWVHGARLTFARNPRYPDAERVRLAAIDAAYLTTDSRAMWNLFKSREIAEVSVDATTLEEVGRAGERLQRHPTSCAALLTFNFREGRFTRHRKVREAVRLALDLDEYVNRVIAVPGNVPLASMFPGHLRGIERPFIEEYPPPRVEPDAKRARALIESVRDEQGGTERALVLLATEGNEKADEYLQAVLSEKLGISVRLDRQTFKQAIARLIAGDFDLAQSRFCSGALSDPDFFAELFHSAGTFNDGAWRNPGYDRIIEQARVESGPRARMDLYGQAQQMLFEHVVVLPTHRIGQVYLQDGRVRGLVRFPVRDFAFGRIAD